jgi:hypothetical protein
MVDIDTPMVPNIVLRCNYCGSYNDTAGLPARGTSRDSEREKGESMASTWRRKRGSDTWHFCSNCSNWPTSDYDTSYSKPSSGEFCNECQAKRANNSCS